MKKVTLTLNGIDIEIFYDTHIKLWTACRIDNGDSQHNVSRDYLLAGIHDLLIKPKGILSGMGWAHKSKSELEKANSCVNVLGGAIVD